MSRIRIVTTFVFLSIALGLVLGCPFDDSLREYLDAHFWLPFAKRTPIVIKNVMRLSVPYAGMLKVHGDSPMAKLRAAYQQIAAPVDDIQYNPEKERQAVAAARADKTLTAREREEVDLIDAKIDMRSDELESAEPKLKGFLRTARTPEFQSEARGWLAHIYYLLGDQTKAGKIYIDELNRSGSNLSRDTVLTSLRMTYGYDGGPRLLAHLEEYFDTPEHAAFAIQLATNPRWDRENGKFEPPKERADRLAKSYARIMGLLEKHRDLLRSETGTHSLALLSMRTALRMGDPPAALKIAAAIPDDSSIRSEPDFLWMLASSQFLSRDYAAAEQPLLKLFQSPVASADQNAAAAYGLCGVYAKTKNPVEQIRYALWLDTAVRKSGDRYYSVTDIDDLSIYWAVSGWDLSLLLDSEASIEHLQEFLAKYPNVPNVRVVKYSLAVRLTRENRYSEAAQIYADIHANIRAPRTRQVAALFAESNRTDLGPPELHQAKFKFAEFLFNNPNRIYYNDAIWGGLQRYALNAAEDNRLTREEHETLTAGERKLKDDQEERWRAYLILRDVAFEEGKTNLGKKAARLALSCLRSFSDRFERQEDIRKGDIEISTWLARN